MSHTPSPALVSSLFLFSILPALAKFTFQNTHPSRRHTQIRFICPSIGETYLIISPNAPTTHQAILCKKHHHLPTSTPKTKRKLTLLFPTINTLKRTITQKPAIIIPFGSLGAIPPLIKLLNNAQIFKQFIRNPTPPDQPKSLILKTRLLLEIATGAIAPYLEFSHDSLLATLSIPDGTAHFSIKDTDIHTTLHIYRRTLTLTSSPPSHAPLPQSHKHLPEVHIQFQSASIAHAALTDTLSSSTAILNKQIVLTGYIPLADALQTLMHRAQFPLKQL
jgi:hypothetical protein